MHFEIISDIKGVEIIAIGNSIRELPRLKKFYGEGRWRKLKGIAKVRLPNKTIHTAKIHWYEASSMGKKEIKIKSLLD